jgi:tetratricopeptide (TPR) repeat protein
MIIRMKHRSMNAASAIGLLTAVSLSAGCSSLNYIASSKAGFEAQQHGDYKKAEADFKAALADAEKRGDKNPDVSVALYRLATVYVLERKFQTAVPALERALALREKQSSSLSATNLEITDTLTRCYQETKQYPKAEAMGRRSLAIAENKTGANGMDVAISLINIGSLLKEEKKYPQALDAYSRAQSIFDKSIEVEPVARASLQNNLAFVYEKLGKADKAEPLLKGALATLEKTPDCSPYKIAAAQNNLALFYTHRGNLAKAETYFKQAVSVPVDASANGQTFATSFMSNYAAMLRKAGRSKEAEAMSERANAVGQ